MNAKSILGSAAALVAIGVIGYAAMAQPGRSPAAEVRMPTINQGTAQTDDNSRECQPGVVDANCVYL